MQSPMPPVSARALFATLLIAPLVGACTKESGAAANPPPDAGAPVPGIESLDVPTQAEADQKAAEEITPENADAEFERLMNEIQGDG